MEQNYDVNQRPTKGVHFFAPHHNVQEDRVKQEFSIKDLENLSGVKAHTIRAWEQRYALLNPNRSSTNIRTYGGEDLKKLLNVALLLERGLKISKIAGLSPKQLGQMVAEGPSVSDEGGEALAKQRLKLAMMTYDEVLFRGTMQECVDRLTFDGAVLNVALPFLAEVGVLWLTDTICPAHEHFMSNLLRQMLFAEIHNAPIPQPEEKGKVIVLYLPEREIHDISLLFLHHLCRSARRQSVFLGQSVPFDDLVSVAAQFEDVCFVSYCTTSPAADQAQEYVDRIDRTFAGSEVTFHLGGGVFKQAAGGANTTVHTDGASLVQKILH